MRCAFTPSCRSRAGNGVRGGLILTACALLSAPLGRTEEPSVFALTGARIIPVVGKPLDKGTIVVRNGIIEAVGATVQIPADARILDAAGLTVYPGLIDALSDAALEEPRAQTPATPGARVTPAAPAAPPVQQQQQTATAFPNERPGLTPYLQAADILNTNNRKIESSRSAGITTALVAPRRGFFQGQSALVNLGGNSPGEMVVRTPVAMHISLQGAGGFGGEYPGSLMGILAFVKQTLLDAQHYEIAWATYGANPGTVRPQYDRALLALQPVLKQQMPVVLPGDTPAQIRRALDLAEAFKLKVIINGAAEAGKIAPLLKQMGVPVLLSAKFPERDRDADPEQEEELEVLRRRVEAPSNAAVLAKEGVRFAFQSGDMANPRDFIRNVARAVEAGLDSEIALRSLTLTPAEFFGVADRLGSIEKGKTANLAVTTGDIFESRTRVKYVFVDGKRYDVTEPEQPRPTEGPAIGATDHSGNWSFKVNARQGPIESALNLIQNGGRLTGTMTSPIGILELEEGRVTENTISFKVSASRQGGDKVVARFTGTVQGNSISGTVDAGAMGKFDFTGSRNPNQMIEH